LRFADEFSTQLTLGVDNLRRGAAPLAPAEALAWKIHLGTEICSIASGPNTLANVLDMTVFVTIGRGVMEEQRQPEEFGESAQPLLDLCLSAETQMWHLAETVLKPEQQAELRSAIEEWRRQHPHPKSLLAARAIGFAAQVAKASHSDTAKTESVFNLLNLDPLSGLDPATREIAQARLFAVRALYVAQRMPTLLRWQTELLAIRAAAIPEVQQLVTNSTQIAASVERFAYVAEQLPGQLSAEREEILKALESQEKNLAPLVNEVRQTLTAGTQMSASLNTTITTFDGLMKRFGIGETNSAAGPPDTNSAPFRVQDYGEAAVRVEAMAKQMTELIRALDRSIDSTNISRLTAQVTPAVQQAQAGGKDVVDYAFWKAMQFLVVAFLAALVYRFLSTRLVPGTRNRTGSP
jgi:hypothetical protein